MWRTKPYPIAYTLQETIDEEVEKMLKLKVIWRCYSSYASPIVLVHRFQKAESDYPIFN